MQLQVFVWSLKGLRSSHVERMCTLLEEFFADNILEAKDLIVFLDTMAIQLMAEASREAES